MSAMRWSWLVHLPKPLVFKIEVDQAGGTAPCGDQIGATLVEETRFARTPHSNHGYGFALDGGNSSIAPSQQWQGCLD